MNRLLFFVSLISSLTFAQQGVCKPGVDCTSNRFVARGTYGGSHFCDDTTNAGWGFNTATSNMSLAWFVPGGRCRNTANNVLSFSVNDYGVRANTTQGFFQSGSTCTGGNCFGAGDGTNALPAFSFTADTDTGFYRVGANQLGVATNGTRSMVWSATAGVLNGTSSNSQLTLNDATGSELLYSSNLVRVTGGSIIAYAPLVQLNSGTGVQFSSTVATTSFNVVNTRLFQADANDHRFYWSGTTPTAPRPPIDFGGGPHPVMERRTYTIDVGYESTATPTWLTGAPRVAGTTGAITVVDAAAAGASSMGSSPGRVAYRSSVTLASAGSISSLISSVAFVRDLGFAPRWCQKVGQFSAGTLRVWAGLASALPGSSATPATHHVSFRYSTGDGDAAWQACYGAGATSCTTTGVAPASAPGSYDLLCIDCREGSAACTFWVNGVARVRQTSSLPTNALAPYYSVEARSANAATLYAGPVSVEVN